MIFVISSGVLRMIFDEHSEAPEATRQQVAREVLEEHIIIVGSHAEAGIAGHVTSRKVDGGIVVNGTKSFNSGSGGARYAHVLHTLEGEQGLHIALIPLIAPGVRLHHDWDNMGQRATVSQKITYQDTFVPDDWHWHIEFDPLLPLLSYVTNASITLGIGEGGFDAMLDYVRTMKRTLTPGWTDGSTDPLVRLRIGELSAQLAAAHALMREVSSSLELLEEGDDLRPPLAATMRTHAICAEAAVTTANRLFELTGARSTANTYRLDRFWRNARTFSVHDPLEAKLNMVGGYELNGELALPFPPRSKK
jgi:alkylation response protein AidB-like acyl-CoA dehydrogenase